ncbi:MAG TPA: mannose-1-phosphate guanylyltransferase [Phycisphaerales bacterium]|nr:mannose-1-phosphate guanylyltransferase [Phycisphaerales bacterium]
MRYAMIMAGGAGTRLWPMSRKGEPKQLLRFISRPGDKKPRALLELADARLDGLIKPEHRYICTAEAYRDAVSKLLPDYDKNQILGEPAARDTVNAVGFAAAILAKEDEDAVFAVLTADHVIEPMDTFRERMDLGFRLVENDPRRFVTFSIKPTYPATGFGYVERGTPVRDAKQGKRAAIDGVKEEAYHVARFVEKPDRARAEVYVESGDYAWNSGMFVWKAQTFLDALKQFKPESYDGLMEIQKAWGTKKFKSVLEEIYPTLPKISVDYAVMEPVTREAQKAEKAGKHDARFSVCTVQMDLQWLDVGSWPSFAETATADKQGNRAAGTGKTVQLNCRNTLSVTSEGHTVALLGVQDIIVVHTPEATLVMHASKAEELKQLHGMLDDDLR